MQDLHSENPPAFKASHRRAIPKTGLRARPLDKCRRALRSGGIQQRKITAAQYRSCRRPQPRHQCAQS